MSTLRLLGFSYRRNCVKGDTFTGELSALLRGLSKGNFYDNKGGMDGIVFSNTHG